MAAKKPSMVPPEPRRPPMKTMQVDPAWLERESIVPPEKAPTSRRPPKGSPPPLPAQAKPMPQREVSLPGIVVEDDWLEAGPSSRGKKKVRPPPLPPPPNMLVAPTKGVRPPPLPRDEQEEAPAPRASKRPPRKA